MKHYDIESCEQLIKDHKLKGYTDKEIYDMLDVVCDYDFFHFDIMQREANEIQLLFLPIDATPEQRHAFIHDTFAKGWSIRTIAAHMAMPKTTVHRMLATPKEKIFQKVSQPPISPSKQERPEGSMTEQPSSPSKLEGVGGSMTKSSESTKYKRKGNLAT